MALVTWRLKEFLDTHDLTVQQLVDQTRGNLSRTGVYRLTVDDLKAVRFESIAAILPALRKLTGEDVQISDLIQYTEGESPKPKARWYQVVGAVRVPDGTDDATEAPLDEHQEQVT